MVAGEDTEATLAWLTHPTRMGHPPTSALISAPESASSSRSCTRLSSSSLLLSVCPRDSRASFCPTAAQCLATVPILPLLQVIHVLKHKKLVGNSATCTQNGAQDSRSSLS